MSRPEDIAGPIIRWDDFGYGGWKPTSFATIKDALESERYSNGFCITKAMRYDVVEVDG